MGRNDKLPGSLSGDESLLYHSGTTVSVSDSEIPEDTLGFVGSMVDVLELTDDTILGGRRSGMGATLESDSVEFSSSSLDSLLVGLSPVTGVPWTSESSLTGEGDRGGSGGGAAAAAFSVSLIFLSQTTAQSP
ncbi:hypothetical protein HG530_007411 [Fusarium avenaceum]|nr:hypothetical protein HG530_007411 [Fusarium avenaceum]